MPASLRKDYALLANDDVVGCAMLRLQGFFHNTIGVRTAAHLKVVYLLSTIAGMHNSQSGVLSGSFSSQIPNRYLIADLSFLRTWRENRDNNVS